MKQLLFILTISISTLSFAQTQRQKDSTMIVNNGVVVFYDFDGQTINHPVWNGGVPFIATASEANSSTATMDSIVNFGKEHLLAFNVVVTRDSTLYFLGTPGRRQRVVFTGYCSWYSCGIGGIGAGTSSMYYADERPVFVFDNLSVTRRKAVEAVHEVGHTLGLSHYSGELGAGTGESGLIKIMTDNGAIYTKNMTLFSTGTGDFGPQDDINDVANYLNIDTYGAWATGTGLRINDVGNSFSTSKYLRKDQSFSAFVGANDSDYYRIEIPSTQTISISVSPWYYSGTSNPTLDAAIDLYDSNGSLVASSSNTTTASATLSQSVSAGTYYIKVRADRGNANNPTGYGFMGHYTINYTF